MVLCLSPLHPSSQDRSGGISPQQGRSLPGQNGASGRPAVGLAWFPATALRVHNADIHLTRPVLSPSRSLAGHCHSTCRGRWKGKSPLPSNALGQGCSFGGFPDHQAGLPGCGRVCRSDTVLVDTDATEKKYSAPCYGTSSGPLWGGGSQTVTYIHTYMIITCTRF